MNWSSIFEIIGQFLLVLVIVNLSSLLVVYSGFVLMTYIDHSRDKNRTEYAHQEG